MKARLAYLAGSVVLLVGTLVGTIVAAGAIGPSLGDVRTATARFHSVNQAEKHGYTVFADCFESDEGGMGQHYVSDALLNDDGAVDATKPEAMVYEVRAASCSSSPSSTS
jgi:hypothetical protein